MDIVDWVSIITAISALTGAVAAALWGRASSAAKDETIKAKEAQIEALRAFQGEMINAKDAQIQNLRVILDQTVKAKDAQIEAVRQETEILRELTPMKLYERFVSMKEQMEEYNDLLASQFQEAQAVISDKDLEISNLRSAGEAGGTEIEELVAERDKLEVEVSILVKRLHDLRETQEALTTLTDARVWSVIGEHEPLIIGSTARLTPWT